MSRAAIASCSTSRMVRPARLQPQDQVEDVVDDLRRQAERRLVEQQQLGRGHQRAGDRQLLLLAARQRAGRLAGALRQDREQGLHFLAQARVARRIAARGGAEPQILRHRQRRKDPPAFRHQVRPPRDDLLGGAAEDRLAGERISPLPGASPTMA